MIKVKFLKEPGYVYDLFFLFTLHFNKDRCLADISDFTKSNADIAHFNKLLSDFGPFSEELLPFFYMKENSKCLMTQFYYEEYASELTHSYSLAMVQEALADHDHVLENAIRFYFENATEETICECKYSPVAINRLIKNSDYSSEIKSSLYSLFLEPAPIIQKLSYELMAKEFLLLRLYEKSFKEIFELQHGFDLNELTNSLAHIADRKIDLEPFEKVFISFCICNNHCIKSMFYNETAILLLSSNYTEELKRLRDQRCIPELDLFGNALSEKNRIDILDLILEKGEVTIRDIEQELGFSGTNAYYHLSLMIKANMIKSRNRGRTVIYSINRHGFDAVCELLSKYSNKAKEGNLA